MTTQAAPSSVCTLAQRDFQTPKVLVVALAHFVHDTYPAFLAPLIPLLMDKLGLSLTLAGSLVLFIRASSVVQPFIGYLADRTELQYFVMAAPALTAVFMSILGLAPSYVLLIPLLVFTGLSSAMFHAPAPAMVAEVSGSELGKGMSFFMAGGELGRSVGPLFIVAVVGQLGLANAYLAAIPGILASLVLYRMLGSMSSQISPERVTVRAALNAQRVPLLLLLGITVVRGITVFNFVTFLPAYLTETGASFFLAGVAVSIFEIAGVAGALLGGTLSDRLGRRTIFLVAHIAVVPVWFAFLHTTGFATFPLLLMAGLIALSTGPVGLTVIQELFDDNRSTATGVYISFSMLTSGVATTLFGALADTIGLPAAMEIIVFVPLLGALLAFVLPETRDRAGV